MKYQNVRTQQAESTDLTYWIQKKMDFNYIDFDRDDSISKEEYIFFLDNFGGPAQKLFMVEDQTSNFWVYALLLTLGLMFAKLGYSKTRKIEDDQYERVDTLL